jgi:hypothetical protein
MPRLMHQRLNVRVGMPYLADASLIHKTGWDASAANNWRRTSDRRVASSISSLPRLQPFEAAATLDELVLDQLNRRRPDTFGPQVDGQLQLGDCNPKAKRFKFVVDTHARVSPPGGGMASVLDRIGKFLTLAKGTTRRQPAVRKSDVNVRFTNEEAIEIRRTTLGRQMLR